MTCEDRERAGLLEQVHPVPQQQLQQTLVTRPLDPVEKKKKKFVCDYCDFRAMTPLGLKKHLNKEHPY